MTGLNKNLKYTPGMYNKKRLTGAQLVENYFRQLDKKRLQSKKEKKLAAIPATICFSRKIGVGALEIADILAKRIEYTTVDRELLEHIAKEANLSKKTVKIFDEKYPGKIQEFLKMIFGEKSFIASDYTRHLTKSVIALAGLTPTIFIGRGTHLLLPRDRVLAVRFICSDHYRIERLARILNLTKEKSKKELDRADKEQRAFFRKVYGKKSAPPYEFDIVINCDYISSPESAADIVEHALKIKFG